MKRNFGLLVLAVLVACSFTVSAQGPGQAQPPAGGGQGRPGGAGGPAGPGGGGRGGAPAQIDFATARKAVEAAEAAATAGNAKVAIAVVDANGDLVYFRRMDGATGVPVPSSQAKARAALLFGVPTKALADAVAAGTPISATVTPAAATGAPIMAVQGGLPLMKNGKVVGAIGVGGSTAANDEMFAQAGVDAVK